MSDVNEKKLKFVETLLTLGSLLAVFLGFVIDKTSAFFGSLITFGVLFVFCAFVSYAGLLFAERITDKWTRRIIRSMSALLGISFGGMVSIGDALVLVQIRGTYPAFLVYPVVVLTLVMSFFAPFLLIDTVLNLPEATEKETPKPNT